MILVQKNCNYYKQEVTVTPVSIAENTVLSSYETIGSSIYANFTTTSGHNDFIVDYGFSDNIQVENLTPNIFSFVDNYAQLVNSGKGKLKINYGFYSTIINLDFSPNSNYNFQKFDNFTIGSYGRWALDQINILIGEKTGITTDLLYYNGQYYATAAAQPGGIARNPSCWAADLDFSGVCVYSHLSHWYGGGYFGGGAAITPRHYIVSHHFEPGNRVGRPLRFVGSDGVVYERTIIAQTTGSEISGTFANSNPLINDLCLFLLDSDLPEEVTVYPIVGDWIVDSQFVSSSPIHSGYNFYNNEYATPFITINQNRSVRFSICSQIYNNLIMNMNSGLISGITVERKSYSGLFKANQNYTNHINFQSNAIAGDSGSPVFALLPDNSLALYTVMTFPSGGTLIHEQLANAMIIDVDTRAGISTGYTVTVASEPII